MNRVKHVKIKHLIHTVSQKNISDIFDCNFKINYQILILFDTNIPDTTCHQMTIQLPTSPNDDWFSSYSRKCRGCFFWDTVYI